MDKRFVICIIIILFIGAFVFLFFYYFKIVPVVEKMPPSNEYYSNNYLALERWLNETGFWVAHINEFELVLSQTSGSQTILAIYPDYLLSTNNEEEILQWVNSGKNVILCLDDAEIIHSLLSYFGINMGETPSYHAYSDNDTPDYYWKIKFHIEDKTGYTIYYDIHNNIRIIRIPQENGSLTFMGLPVFMNNENIGKEANARLAWELLTKPADGAAFSHEGKQIVILQRRQQEKPAKQSIFGTLMQRGNLYPAAVSAVLLIIFGFWMVIPVFGQIKTEKQRSTRPIKDRFTAEINFLKKYNGLYYYDDALAAINKRADRKEKRN